jgi:hypothetical protein
VNVHLPFKDENTSETEYNELLTYTNNFYQNIKTKYNPGGENVNVIIMGDFNTRSKVDDTCIDDFENCSNVKFIKDATEEVSALQGKLNNCFKNEDEVEKCKLLKDGLIKKDYFNEYKTKPEFEDSGFIEENITFYPSYKFKESKYDGPQEYSLQKGKDKRLAGYPDRILYKGYNNESLKGSDYRLCVCNGNDHYPVMLTLTSQSLTSQSLTDLQTKIGETNTTVEPNIGGKNASSLKKTKKSVRKNNTRKKYMKMTRKKYRNKK